MEGIRVHLVLIHIAGSTGETISGPGIITYSSPSSVLPSSSKGQGFLLCVFQNSEQVKRFPLVPTPNCRLPSISARVPSVPSCHWETPLPWNLTDHRCHMCPYCHDLGHCYLPPDSVVACILFYHHHHLRRRSLLGLWRWASRCFESSLSSALPWAPRHSEHPAAIFLQCNAAWFSGKIGVQCCQICRVIQIYVYIYIYIIWKPDSYLECLPLQA